MIKRHLEGTTMRTAILSLIILLAVAGCSKPVLDFRNAELSNGLFYGGGDNEPFTGTVTNVPQSYISIPTLAFNDVLYWHNQMMTTIESKDNTLYGTQLLCDVEVKEGLVDGAVNCSSPNTRKTRWFATYKDGLPDGEAAIFDASGEKAISKVSFVQGRLEGVQKTLSPNTGTLVLEIQYKDGKKEEVSMWNEVTGNRAASFQYKHDELNGLVKKWNSEGVLISEQIYVDGFADGPVKTWHSNGKIHEITVVRGSYIDGPYQQWNSDGKLLRSGKYNKGEFIPDALPEAEDSAETPINSMTQSEQSASQEAKNYDSFGDKYKDTPEYKDAYDCGLSALKEGSSPVRFCVGNYRDPSGIEMQGYSDAEKDFSSKRPE